MTDRGIVENGHSLKDQSYRLDADSLGIRNFASRERVGVTVPAGATITVVCGPYNGELLLEVVWDGEDILIFTEDVRLHATLV